MAINTRGLLKIPGFRFFLLSQSLGAFNQALLKAALALAALRMFEGSPNLGGLVSLVFVASILPFFLFSGYAGYLADAFNKRRVFILFKFAGFLAVGLGCWILMTDKFPWMLVVLTLISLQTVFSEPSSLGMVPEVVQERDISRANSVLQAFSYLIFLLGLAAGCFMMERSHLGLRGIRWILLAAAAAGFWLSHFVPQGAAVTARGRFSLNPFDEITRGFQIIRAHRTIRLAVLGAAFFYAAATLIQIALLLFANTELGFSVFRSGVLWAFLILGVGIGSWAAGRLSGPGVEIGLIPLGLAMAGFFILVLFATNSFRAAATALALAGFGGGFALVPLVSLAQQRSPSRATGRVIATSGFFNACGAFLAAVAFWLLRDKGGFRPSLLLLFCGFFTLMGTAYMLVRMPGLIQRVALWLLTHTVYKARVKGAENVPLRGAALLVGNHVSWLDGFLVGACTERFVRFTLSRPNYNLPGLSWLFRLMRAIPAGPGPDGLDDSIDKARAELKAGHVVCLFAEGAISRTGNVLPFKASLERILEGLDVPVVPVYLDGLWGSIFSFFWGKIYWKFPERLRTPVYVTFGTPREATVGGEELRQAILRMGGESALDRVGPDDLLHLGFLRTAKRHLFSFFMADSSGREMNFLKALTASLMFSRWVRRRCVGEEMVGILIPATVAGALANFGVSLAGKIPINLNFTAGPANMKSALEQCKIRTVLTAAVVLEKLNLPRTPEMVFMEDVVKQFGALARLTTLCQALFLPYGVLRRRFCPEKIKPSDLATVIFSSGSTGMPKGVMLSHQNIICNMRACEQVIWITSSDRILGVLPFFHSFGFTVTLWLPAVSGFGVVFHSNPSEAKTIGEMVSKYKATILVSTPTFYSAYARKCEAKDFASVRYAVAGAEKLRATVASAFQEKFGFPLYEGYGCTEMAPVVAANLPDVEQTRERQVASKPGSVGHPLPGICVRVVDPDTSKELPPLAQGLIQAKGPNQMMGYLGAPDKTREVLKDGWYVTGDIGWMDEDGFLHLTDRLFRFSKIAGEMVPHIRVEEELQALAGDEACAVTAVPDEKKGERLVVLYTNPELNPLALWEHLSKGNLPKLWIPKREDIFLVEAIPILGTGKTDLREIKRLAMQKVGMRVE